MWTGRRGGDRVDAVVVYVRRGRVELVRGGLHVVVVQIERQSVILKLKLYKIAQYKTDEKHEYDDYLQGQVGLFDASREHREQMCLRERAAVDRCVDVG